MVNKKKLTAGVAALILCITGVTYGTLAYFTDKDTRANVITIGHVTGTLTETDEHMRDDNTIGKDYTNVKPGDVLDKDPTQNTKSINVETAIRPASRPILSTFCCKLNILYCLLICLTIKNIIKKSCKLS